MGATLEAKQWRSACGFLPIRLQLILIYDFLNIYKIYIIYIKIGPYRIRLTVLPLTTGVRQIAGIRIGER